jgi:two-component system sensor histidine kinase KdpD
MKPAERETADPLREWYLRGGTRQLRGVLLDLAKACGVIALTTLACWTGKSILTPEASCLIFLGVTVLFGAFMSPPAPLFLAAMGLLSWNFFFTPPVFELRIRTSDELTLHLLFVLIAMVMNKLTADLKRREHQSRLSEAAANLRRECQEALNEGDLERFLRSIDKATGGVASVGPATGTDPCLVTPAAPGQRPDEKLRLRFEAPASPDPKGRELIEDLSKLLSGHQERQRFIEEAETAKTAALSERIGRALLDNVTHEMKTPVSYMLASAHRIRSRDDGRHETETRAIAEAANRLTRLTEELTLMSSVRSQMLRPRVEHCDACELARDILEQDVRRELAAAVDLIGLSPEACVSTDPHLAGIVLSNLVSNACRHSPPGRRVELVVEHVGEEVFFRVRDHGKGVSAEDRPRIFERFYRGDNPGSLGLGLSISREIAGIIGATIAVTETEGGGATFSMALPAAKPYHAGDEAVPPRP